jgi:hypothetical protein
MTKGPMQFGETLTNDAAGDPTRLIAHAPPRAVLQVSNVGGRAPSILGDFSETGVVGQGSKLGVEGEAIGETFATGVSGRSSSLSGIGVDGTARGLAAPGGDRGIGVRGTGREFGVAGIGNIGVDGQGDGGGLNIGVRAGGEFGVIGNSLPGASANSAGVLGAGQQNNGNGVIGEANNGAFAYGVWGKSSTGEAGHFSGRVTVIGLLTKAGGGFRIDHPLAPEHKYLCHSFVESPDATNVYNGNVTTDEDGNVGVVLPEYFEALNQDFCYQLTVIGDFAQAVVAEEIKDNHFKIRTDRPNVKVCWQVTGVRKDAFTNMYRMAVEEEKPNEERGTYLHPEAFDQPETRGAEYARESELRTLQAKIREVPSLEIEEEADASPPEAQ